MTRYSVRQEKAVIVPPNPTILQPTWKDSENGVWVAHWLTNTGF